jgi:integrase
MQRIDTKSGRERLRPRREPYWLKLETGRFLGYRQTEAGGYWQARFRDGAGRQHYHQLGQSTGDDFTEAKRAAEEWFKTVTGGGGAKVRTGTVAAACEAYCRELEGMGRATTAKDARARFAQCVNDVRPDGSAGDRLGAIRFDALTRDDVLNWRDRLQAAGHTNVKGKSTGRDRTPSTTNRMLRTLKAALNKAVRIGYAGNPAVWQTVEALPNADKARTVFLNLAQRRKLLAAAGPELRQFLTALLYTGARPGELTRATVADLDSKSGTLTLRSAKGRGGQIRPRAVHLTPDAMALLKAAAKRKLPAAPLLTAPGGVAWEKMPLSRAVRRAAAAAKLPPGVVAYTLRHAAISEWLSAGINPVTVAKRAGTSVLMIEKNYHKHIAAPEIETLKTVTLL